MERSMKPLLPLLLALALPAQKMPLADGSERVVAVLDVGELIAALPDHPLGEPAPWTGGATKVEGLQRIATFLRAFSEPPLPEADLQPLGGRFLVVLGPPERIATVERLLAHARESAEQQFQVNLRFVSVSAACFERDLRPKIDPNASSPVAAEPQLAVVSAAEAQAMLRKIKADVDSRIVQAPQVIAPPLLHTVLAVGKQIAYVRDFTLEVVDGAYIANPVVDTIWNGQRLEAICAELPDGTIGVQMEALDQVVEQPIRGVKTTVPGTTFEVTVQVPRASGCRGRQAVALPKGTTAVMAAKKSDGSWLVTLLEPTAIRSGPAVRSR
jgi:hypothetical protein